MIIDVPRPEAMPVLKAIWQEAFGDNETFVDGFFRTGFAPERCRCLFLEERPVAVLYWFDCFLGEKKLSYIYAVATDKAYRGRGLCRQLMADTHSHLKAAGYSAAVLVPGSEKLFSMYENMGYRSFCPMQHTTVTAAASTVAVDSISAREFFRLRKSFLPEGGIVQDSAADYLDTFSGFYRTRTGIMCLSKEDGTLYFQEFLGDRTQLPGIVNGLQAQKAIVNLPGGNNYAMYLSLDGTDLQDAYFGISLG